MDLWRSLYSCHWGVGDLEAGAYTCVILVNFTQIKWRFYRDPWRWFDKLVNTILNVFLLSVPAINLADPVDSSTQFSQSNQLLCIDSGHQRAEMMRLSDLLCVCVDLQLHTVFHLSQDVRKKKLCWTLFILFRLIYFLLCCGFNFECRQYLLCMLNTDICIPWNMNKNIRMRLLVICNHGKFTQGIYIYTNLAHISFLNPYTWWYNILPIKLITEIRDEASTPNL